MTTVVHNDGDRLSGAQASAKLVAPLLASEFTTSATYTAAWRDKGAQVFNILTYGAVGNGIADDRSAIQAAIDAAFAAGGGVVFAPAATYRITSSVTVKSGVTIAGAGWTTIFLMDGAWAASNGCFVAGVAGAVSQIGFRDFQIEGQKAGKAITSTARGIYVERAAGVRITRVKIKDCSHAGIFFNGGCSDIVINGAQIFGGGDNTNGAYANGIRFDIGLDAGGTSPTTDAIVTGCTLVSITDSSIGVHNNVSGVTIAGNTIDGGGTTPQIGHAIDLAGCNKVTVAGNTIRRWRGVSGIYAHENLGVYDCLDIVISGNTLEGVGATTAAANGIKLEGTVTGGGAPNRLADRMVITGNTVRNWGNGGIYLAVEARFCVVEGNLCHANANGIVLDHGALGKIEYNEIRGNHCYLNTSYGIFLSAAVANNVIQANLIHSNTTGPTNATALQKRTNWFANNLPDEGQVTMGGHLLASASNTYDIGDTSGNSPRSIHAVTSFVAPASHGQVNPAFGVDVSPYTAYTLANDAAFFPMTDANNFSGLVLIHNTVNGSTGLFLVGGGTIAQVSASIANTYSTAIGTASRMNVYLAGTTGLVVTVQNKLGSSADVRVMVLRLRALN
jgi:parallel beta-helix repeat protein